MDAREILKTLIREYGGTQKVFASIIGTTQPTIANWMAQNQIPEGGIAKICRALPDVSFEWLTGQEDTPRSGYQDESAADAMPMVGKPYYNRMPASAGQLTMGDNNVTTERIYIPGIQVSAYFPVVGNSMDPTIQSGDIVGIRQLDNLSRIRPNDIYLIFTRDNERMLKRIKGVNGNDPYLTLYSDNPAYDPFPVLKEQILIVYKVVCIIRSLE
ncbi:MAG: helix-turn-helix transcriptional regulator [Bacteroidaceae bacterium]|nr:helix-turn-helix transcriptional regulator [Bacteroidaceae bacterium]